MERDLKLILFYNVALYMYDIKYICIHLYIGKYVCINCYICVMISTFAVVFSGQNYKKR